MVVFSEDYIALAFFFDIFFGNTGMWTFKIRSTDSNW